MAQRFEVIEEITTENIANMTTSVNQQIKDVHAALGENSNRQGAL
jgi:hypothetical protein